MAQIEGGTGFRYPFDALSAYEPLREKLSSSTTGTGEYDRLVQNLTERDRALEDHFASAVPIYDEVLTFESTTSTTATDLATVGPTCVVKLPRGRCIITVSCLVSSTVTNQSCLVDTFMDGSLLQGGVILGNNTGGSLSASLSSTVMFSNLDPGTHTFQLKYWQTLGGATASFEARSLMVTPIP